MGVAASFSCHKNVVWVFSKRVSIVLVLALRAYGALYHFCVGWVGLGGRDGEVGWLERGWVVQGMRRVM